MGLTSPNPVGDSGIYLLRTGELRTSSSSIPGVSLGGLVPRTESTALGGLVPRTERTALGGLVPLAESTVLGGLVPRTEHAALGGLPLTSAAFHNFRTHEPRIRIDGFSAPPGRFAARVSASVATIEGCTGRGSISPAADTVFASVLPYPSRAARAPQKPWLQRRPSYRRLLYQGALQRRRTPPQPPARLCPSLPCLALQPLRRRRRADEQRQQPVMHPRCRIRIRARRGASAISQTRSARYSPADWKREQHAEPTCHAMMRYISIDRPPILPPDFSACYPLHKRPSLSDMQELVRVDYIQPTTTSSYSSVARHCRQQGLINLTLWGELLAC